jgi:16S rRNA (uracil1498-N3)-methyltransferase
MITLKQNGYLILAHLSDIELYYSDPDFIKNDRITLEGEEFHHSVNVMRNSVGDSIYITDGKGKIYNCEINEIDKNELKATIQSELEFENTTADIWFCIPVLKNPDRLKFALEKCVELGITNFILFTSKRTIPKKINTDKIEKITVAAMKQSLRAFLPNITSAKFEEVIKLQGEKILFEQSAEKDFSSEIISSIPIYFLFGPEGGFDESEINLIHTAHRYRLSTNRLRSETAIIKCASLLTFP